MTRLAWPASALALVLLVAACGTSSPAAAPHGGHSSSKAAPVAAPLRTGERFSTLTMPAAYAPNPPNGGTDDYRCFLIDPKLAGQAYLTGAQFQPQNPEVVHHAIFFRLDPQQAAKAKDLDASTPGQGWTCFGDAGVRDASWVSHWAPGTNEILLDPTYGYQMPVGGKLVMQVHYNTLGLKGPPGTDQSSIRLRLTDQPLRQLHTELFPAQVELPCTPQESGPLCDRTAAVADVGRRFGEDSKQQVAQLEQFCANNKPVPGPTQHCDLPVEEPVTAHALAGHMHLLGRSIKVELNPGKPGAQTLLDVPAYNFDDQALRPLAKPVQLAKGDVVRVTCTHDAGLRAQLPQLRELQPRYVVWGEGTSDEMCLGIVIVSQS